MFRSLSIYPSIYQSSDRDISISISISISICAHVYISIYIYTYIHTHFDLGLYVDTRGDGPGFTESRES